MACYLTYVRTTLFRPLRTVALQPRSSSNVWQKTSSSSTLTSARHLSNRGFRNPPPRYNRFGRAQRIQALWYNSPAFRYAAGGVGLGGGFFYYTNLETVPVSGRRRFNFVSPELEKSISEGGFNQILQQYQGRILPQSHPMSQTVQRVMKRLIPVSGLADEKWEVRVIDDPNQKNAFVMPGGKVFVFSGILPVCGDDDGLAAVLGHEISHTVAHHVGEKISKSFILGFAALALAFFIDTSAQTTNLLLTFLLELPNSRKQESEADYIGLQMMSQACYNPQAAVGLWQRMTKDERGAPPQFLSTHPASKNRVEVIQKWVPEAMDRQAQSDCAVTSGYADQFSQAFKPKNYQETPVRRRDDDDYFF